MSLQEPPTPDSQSQPKVPIFNAPPLTVWACLACIAMFVAVRLGGYDLRHWILYHLAFFPGELVTLTPAKGPSAALLWPLVTYSFLHLDWLHLLLNMGFLLAFGSVVERTYGAWRFLTIYVVSAAGGALAQALGSSLLSSPMIGASGVVYGMMGAAVPIMFRAHRPGVRSGFSRGLYFVAMLMVLNIFIAWINGSGWLFGAAIAWQAHIGGFAAGLAVGFIMLFAATAGSHGSRR